MPHSVPKSSTLRSPKRAALPILVLLAGVPLLVAPLSVAEPDRPAWTESAQDETHWIPGRMRIKFRSPLDAHSKASPSLRMLLGDALASARPILRRHVLEPQPGGVERLFELTLPVDADVPRLAAKLSQLSDVEYAEPVLEHRVVGDAGELGRVPGIDAVPNDPQYPTANQAYLAPMQVELAWNVVKGQDTNPVVCIIDGGTNWQHEDLMANMWVNPGETAGNLMDDDFNGYVDDVHGWDFRDNDGNPRGNWNATPSNSNHGTHTAGLMAAVTDNGVGIACASWNPRLMAVNASSTNDNSIGYGYEGIVYAADNGADIVSLSWGGFDTSQAEQDIIDYAVAQGVLVIAAAGNNNATRPFYPAAYRDVIAVANVWGSGPAVDQRYSTGSGSNYGGWIDVAATGTAVYSTHDFNSTNVYGSSTGTSMSAPVAAGVAALIKALHPTWGPLEVGEQLRVTCDNINALNPSTVDLLGRGRVNAFRAVTESSPAVRLVDWTLQDADANGELNQGESVTVSFDARNHLASVTDLVLTLSSPSPHVTVVDGSESIGALATGATTSAANAFSFTVSPSAPPGTLLDLRVDMNGTGYADFQWLPIVLEPAVETHDVNNLRVSLTSSGNVGWIGFPGGQGDTGQGLSFLGGPNVLFEGALMIGQSTTALSDAARASGEHTDFAVANNVPPSRNTPGTRSDQEIVIPSADTANASTPLGVRVDMTSFAYASPPDDDFVLVGYEITNIANDNFSGLRVGLFFDWDIDANGYAQNNAGWDAARRLGYAWNSANASLPTFGVMVFGGPEPGYSAIRNDGVGQPVNLYSGGFSKSEKWTLLNGGTGIHSVGPADISNCLSTGPFDLAVGESLQVWFALLAGTDLADLQWNADRALAVFGDSIQTSIDEPLPEIGQLPARRLVLARAVPNPFGPSTRLAVSVDRRRHIHLALFDVRGRLVRTLADGVEPPGLLQIGWDGRDANGDHAPAGVYMLTLRSEMERQVQRLVLTH